MKYTLNNDLLTILLEGRVDSSNAPKTEEEIFSILNANQYNNFIIDVENLEYISSAGLRVILKCKKNNPKIKIVNASSEVYEIFEMTGFSEMIPIEKAFKKMSVDGCEIIGQGAKGIVYRYNDDTIIKVYKNPDSLPDIKNERELARRAFVLGIPTAISYDIVKVGNSYGSVFELLNAKSYSKLIANDTENRDKYINEYALLLKKIHSTQVKETDMPNIKPWMINYIDASEPYLKKEDAEKIRKLITDVPDRLNMLHCDYHTNNVMSQNGETLLIDMDTLSHGHPIFELANIYVTYVGFGMADPKIVETFVKMPYETAVYIWKKFLPTYLGTDDESIIKAVENKAKLISDIRAIRHHIRYYGADSEEAKKAIPIYKADIEAILPTISTLEF